MEEKKTAIENTADDFPLLPHGEDCCGCGACSQACPHSCISMRADKEGFLYPETDTSSCVRCGLCMNACPSLNSATERKPQETFAAVNKSNDVRDASSSGGFFTLMAEDVIRKGGIVFGAVFNDDWQVVHGSAETMEQLKAMRGSKYVQSDTGKVYRSIRAALRSGRKVLFTGTPCQVAGLKRFLGRDYDLLLTADVICHGVPSPRVWKAYLEKNLSVARRRNPFAAWKYRKKPMRQIRNIEFRNKCKGWLDYHFRMQTAGGRILGKRIDELHRENDYMKLFLNNVCLRPSCYKCLARCGKSHSDLTMADFWNVQLVTEGFSDNRGTSLVLCNTQKGIDAFAQLECVKKEVSFDDAIQYNKAWMQIYEPHADRDDFFRDLEAGVDVFEKYAKR